MKNIKYLFLVLTIAFTGISCESYDDYDTNRIPIAGFTRKTMNINNIGGPGSSKSEEVEIFVAGDVSSSDRSFNITDIEIDNPDEFLPTDRENFDYEDTVIIPAGERRGVITVTGINHTLTGTRTYFRLAVQADPGVGVGTSITIGLRE